MATIRKREWTTGTGELRTRWQCDYTDQSGTRRAKQFATRKAADAFLTGARYEVATGTHTPASAKTTVADAIRAWLDHSEAKGLDAQTVRTYRVTAKHHVLPQLGRERLARLTRPALEKFVDDLLAGRVPDGKPRSRIMARRAIGALKAALKEAQRRGLVAQNVASGVSVDATRGEAKARKEAGVHVPSKEDARAILAAAAPRWRALVTVATFCGLPGQRAARACLERRRPGRARDPHPAEGGPLERHRAPEVRGRRARRAVGAGGAHRAENAPAGQPADRARPCVSQRERRCPVAFCAGTSRARRSTGGRWDRQRRWPAQVQPARFPAFHGELADRSRLRAKEDHGDTWPRDHSSDV